MDVVNKGGDLSILGQKHTIKKSIRSKRTKIEVKVESMTI